MESAEKTDSLNCCSGFRADPDNIKEDRKESAICFFFFVHSGHEKRHSKIAIQRKPKLTK